MRKRIFSGNLNFSQKVDSLNRFKIFAFVGAFALTGVIVFFMTQAATPTGSLEPESGTVSSPAITGTDATASGGSYVQFKQGTTGGSTAGRAFANNSPFNTPIPANATWRDEPALRANHWWVNREQYSMPYSIANGNDPMVTVDVPSTWGWAAGPISIRVPSGVTGDSGTDASIVVKSGNTVCDFWQFSRKSDTYATAVAYACTDFVTGSGFGSTNPWKGAGIRAAGSSTLGGLILGEDFSSGTKEQAFSVSMLPSILKRGWVSPAISEDSGNGYSGTIPMGSRIGIPSGTAKPAGLSASGTMVWNTLIKYGAFVLDQHYGDSPVIMYADPRSTTNAQIEPVRVWWNGTGPSDLDKIMPYIRVLQ